MSLLFTIVAVIIVLVVGRFAFEIYRDIPDREDKLLAGSLTSGFLVVIVALFAWYFVHQQITTAQQQANVALADMLDRHLTLLNRIRQQIETISIHLISSGLTSLSPIQFRLNTDTPQQEKYQEQKTKIESVWQENDDLARAAIQLRSGEVSEKVQAYITNVIGMKTIATIVIGRMDAILEHCPHGGAVGAVQCDERFSQERQAIDKLIVDTTFEKHKDAVGALSLETAKLSNRLRVIDHNLEKE
jgi:hypothetical protein